MRSGLKTSVENDIFWSEIAGQDLENQAVHLHQEFPGVPPQVAMASHAEIMKSISNVVQSALTLISIP